MKVHTAELLMNVIGELDKLSQAYFSADRAIDALAKEKKDLPAMPLTLGILPNDPINDVQFLMEKIAGDLDRVNTIFIELTNIITKRVNDLDSHI